LWNWQCQWRDTNAVKKNAMAIQTQGNEQLEAAVGFFTQEHSTREKMRIQIKLDTKF